MKNKLFGTDGIRGKANQFPILPEIILKVGKALGTILIRENKGVSHPMVLIGKDTRLSGYMLEQALASGLNSVGVWVQLTGPLPTPGIGFLAQNMRAHAGVIISASHNFYEDNGIKIFGADGFKISDEIQDEIEKRVFSDEVLSTVSEVGRTRRIDDAAGRYIVYVKNTFPHHLTLDGMKIVLDCANGAAYRVAPAIFGELGAEVIVIGNNPNGYNINKNCGALFPENLKKAVLEHKAHVGIALDGDADRVVMVDEKGSILNGDHILGILALHLKKTRSLKKVVSTVMSNMGLEKLLRQNSIDLVREDVGDRNVIKRMLSENIMLGGEPSGHIIFSGHTGDACIAALSVLSVMKSEGKKLSDLISKFSLTPQVVKSVPIKQKKSLEKLKGYDALIQDVEKKLGNQGRFHVRFSGTEPIARVLVEAEDPNQIQFCVNKISKFIEAHLN